MLHDTSQVILQYTYGRTARHYPAGYTTGYTGPVTCLRMRSWELGFN